MKGFVHMTGFIHIKYTEHGSEHEIRLMPNLTAAQLIKFVQDTTDYCVTYIPNSRH